jgi:hypothetical protein
MLKFKKKIKKMELSSNFPRAGRNDRQDEAWEVAGIVLPVTYIIRRLRSSMAIYYK